jgi:hypothetical protein
LINGIFLVYICGLGNRNAGSGALNTKFCPQPPCECSAYTPVGKEFPAKILEIPQYSKTMQITDI